MVIKFCPVSCKVSFNDSLIDEGVVSSQVDSCCSSLFINVKKDNSDE